jgi:hypothetical protein
MGRLQYTLSTGNKKTKSQRIYHTPYHHTMINTKWSGMIGSTHATSNSGAVANCHRVILLCILDEC